MVSEMEIIGRNMVKTCKNSPLVISWLGGILYGKSLREWEIINKDTSFYLTSGGTSSGYDVARVIGLSYDSLPARLKQCFLCLACYEEDKDIETEELYRIWIAEGLVSVDDKPEGSTMLDVAERYLDELANRSLIQINVGPWEGNKTCCVHDLIRDLCLAKLKEEKHINVFHLIRGRENESRSRILRKLCICSYADNDESMLKPYEQQVTSNIRSLFVRKAHSSIGKVLWPDKIISLEKLKLLRVLTVSRYEFTSQNLHDISKLVFLNCLCLGDCWLEELPSSIGNLRNLETLDIRVSNRIGVPNVLWKLKLLKQLYLPENFEVIRVDKLRFEGLNQLERICNYNSTYCDTDDLIQLDKPKVFDGTTVMQGNLTDEIIDFIRSREPHREGRGLRLILLLESHRAALENIQ